MAKVTTPAVSLASMPPANHTNRFERFLALSVLYGNDSFVGTETGITVNFTDEFRNVSVTLMCP